MSDIYLLPLTCYDSHEMILPDVQLYTPHPSQNFRHNFHPLVLLVHHLRAELAYFVRYELIDRYKYDGETDTGQERQTHLIVEQIEGDGDLRMEFIKSDSGERFFVGVSYLKRDAPEGVETGARVYHPIRVG